MGAHRQLQRSDGVIEALVGIVGDSLTMDGSVAGVRFGGQP